MSSASIPKTTKAWTVEGSNGFDALKLHQERPIPEVSGNDGMYPFPMRGGMIPASDGAGEVIAVGSKVSRFQPGAKVVTLFNQNHIGGSHSKVTASSGVGGMLDGTLTQYGVFNEQGLVAMPSNLTYLEGATLSCAALTAWNALHGLVPLLPGQVVLTQGTGGVSIFALQFAKAAGATVIATTSSAAKAEMLKKLGADHVINYKDEPNWGEKAKSLTPDGEGVHQILEVAGPKTMAQSLKAIRMDGVISIIGFVGGEEEKQPTFLETLSNICTVRGIFVGSRAQMEDMHRAIEAHNIKPVVDKKVFTLDEVKEAYQYQWDQKHFGKLAIKIE
ncbi:putative alcohol dehydrogenase-4 [Coleophoma crateriformis]|uniref:Putative alcohol dehydrogenase-4 n=1 Tax=Coleophoma crateriformis TaxID=565419 RepID=A0A3D8S309_9HELO|nr:putative alcohol dehydrogenase-4 [Coleophoma crateriformis]